MRHADFDPEGTRLPIKIDRTSNGEYLPPRLTRRQKLAQSARPRGGERECAAARPVRRAFLVSAAGAASTLAACNRANPGARRPLRPRRPRPRSTSSSPRAAVGGDEFIFDVQTHCVEPTGRWATGRGRRALGATLRAGLRPGLEMHRTAASTAIRPQTLAKEVFLDSDTDVAVVSALWGQPNPTPIDYADEAREIVAAIGGEGARAPDPRRRLPAGARRDRGDGREGRALPGRSLEALSAIWRRTAAASSSTAATTPNRFFERARRARRDDGRRPQGRAAARPRI